MWRCILRKQLQKIFAIILGCMSVAILLAEATILPAVDLSLFSILINAVENHELLVQVKCSSFLCFFCTYMKLIQLDLQILIVRNMNSWFVHLLFAGKVVSDLIITNSNFCLQFKRAT